MRRVSAAVVVLVVLGVGLFLAWPDPDEPVAGAERRSSEVRLRSVAAPLREDPSGAVVVAPEVRPEEDNPERLAYRAELGAIADEVGLAVVECAFRDPHTGGEVGRHVVFVDGVDNPDSGDARRKAVQTTEDDFDRHWRVEWDLPEGATHGTCKAELAEVFTLVLDVGDLEVTRASCGFTLRPGPNEMPVLRTPCSVWAEGARQVPVPQMKAGQVYTVFLEPEASFDEVEEEEPEDLGEEEPEDPEEALQELLDREEHIYDESAKWAGLVSGMRSLRDQTPDWRIRDLIDADLADYGWAVAAWEVEEDQVSNEVDDVLEGADPP